MPSRRQTGSVDDALRPAGVPQVLKLLRHILHDRRLPIGPVQQALNLR
jgi:hypothetical protein